MYTRIVCQPSDVFCMKIQDRNFPDEHLAVVHVRVFQVFLFMLPVKLCFIKEIKKVKLFFIETTF